MGQDRLEIARPEPTLSYCVLHYFNQWLSEDRHYIHALRETRQPQKHRDAINRFCGFYKVRRCFPTAPDKTHRLEKVRLLLFPGSAQSAKEPLAGHLKPLEHVTTVEKKLRKRYKTEKQKNHSKLSATTKLLWLRQRVLGDADNYSSDVNNIVIYDSKACSALGYSGRNYGDYLETWHETYEPFSDDISTLCEQLSVASSYMLEYDKEAIQHAATVTQQSWFHERVFDIYLWFLGDRHFELVD